MTVVRCLSRYLSDNPNACDTSEGIARWWLSLEVPLPMVQAALVLMQRCGVVQESRAIDGQVRFRRYAAEAVENSATEIAVTSRLHALSHDPMSVLVAIGPNTLRGLH